MSVKSKKEKRRQTNSPKDRSTSTSYHLINFLFSAIVILLAAVLGWLFGTFVLKK